MSDRYATFLRILKSIDPRWTAEHRFHPVRCWRFDLANPALRLAIEIDGGIWTRGRHSRGKGQAGDMEKGNEAVRLGWFVLHFTPQQVQNGTALRFITNPIPDTTPANPEGIL